MAERLEREPDLGTGTRRPSERPGSFELGKSLSIPSGAAQLHSALDVALVVGGLLRPRDVRRRNARSHDGEREQDAERAWAQSHHGRIGASL
jgi:hypothetical protein